MKYLCELEEFLINKVDTKLGWEEIDTCTTLHFGSIWKARLLCSVSLLTCNLECSIEDNAELEGVLLKSRVGSKHVSKGLV